LHVFKRPARYLAGLNGSRYVLWCYLIWYGVVVVRYFDPNPLIWLTAAGLSLIIGTALWINATRSGRARVRLEAWPVVRLYLFPFCVSSFSSLVKGKGFLLVFSPHVGEMLVALGLCAGLALAAVVARRALGSADGRSGEEPSTLSPRSNREPTELTPTSAHR
jgi:hypothetical protein